MAGAEGRENSARTRHRIDRRIHNTQQVTSIYIPVRVCSTHTSPTACSPLSEMVPSFSKTLLLCIVVVVLLLICQITPTQAIKAPSPQTKAKSSLSLLTSISISISIRGGAYLQPNPNYDNPDPNQFMPPTLGSMDNNHIQRSSSYQDAYSAQSNAVNNAKAPTPIAQVIREFFTQLHQSSPCLYYGTVSSIIVFILWQLHVPTLASILRNHFVCSQYNLSQGRYHTLITSSISHATLSHIFMNLYGFLMFGKSVEPILKMNDMSLSAFCILGTIFANAFFAMLHPQGSCIGLSGVALSLLAFDAKLNPSKEIGFLVKFIPIRLPAQYALTGLLVWSLLGMAATRGGRGDGVAHATHLGGLLYGIGVFELMNRGIWRRGRRRWIRLLASRKRRGTRTGRGRFSF